MTSRKKITIVLWSILCIVAILGVYYYTSHSLTHTSSVPADTHDVAVAHTTWELVEHTQGQTIDNLTGTDWTLSFDEQSGIFILCDTHPFTYFIHKDRVTFDFSAVSDVHCQNTSKTKESQFINFLKQSPIAERLQSPDARFAEVLTFSHGDEKLVFISNTEKKLSQTRTKNITLYTDAVYTGMFTVTPFNTDTGTVGTVSSTVATNEQGIGTLALPVGTYQISLARADPQVVLLPSIFSVTDSETKQTVTLSVKKKK